MENISILAGRSHINLVDSVCSILNISPTKRSIIDFANREIGIEIQENIRKTDVYIIQTGSNDSEHSINDHLVELLGLIDCCRYSSANTITVIIPYFPYSRSDKKDKPRVPIMASMICRTLSNLGINRVVAVDLHAGQTTGFGSVPIDNLYAIKYFENYLNQNIFDIEKGYAKENCILVSPDAGGIKRVIAYAKNLEMDHIILHKQRSYTKANTVENSIIVGDVALLENKIAIIIDDMIDTMGTMKKAAEELMKYNVKGVVIMSTHGILSGPAFDNIMGCDIITDVIVTNTLPQENNLLFCSKLHVIDISPLIAETIRRLVEGGSISELFV